MEKNVYIRADGDSTLGMGHIIRTSALAEVLIEKGYRIIYLSKMNHTLKKFFQGNSLEYIDVLEDEIGFINNLIKPLDIVIFDLFKADKKYMSAIRKDIFKFVFDNLEKIDIPSNLYLHGTIYGSIYKDKADKLGINFIGGPEYVIMREEFRKQEKRKLNERVKNILITMGGADPLHMTNNIIEDILGEGYYVTAVEGNAFSEKINRDFPSSVDLIINPDNMSQLMKGCDICISAGGTSTYELAITGTPTIVYRQADNQILQCEKFASLGALIDLGDGRKYDGEELRSSLRELSNDYEKRKTMSQKGQELLDGKGVYRVAEAMEEYYCKWKEGLR